jgi:ABC-type bacteriocin/lantibiotic exporter with double-glycine peptidase domain
MQVASNFLDSLSVNLALNADNDSPLLKCLKKIISQLGLQKDLSSVENINTLTAVNFTEYSSSLGILFSPVNTTASYDLKKSYFPLLIQTISGGLYVCISRKSGKTYLYDPINACETPIDNINAIDAIVKIWQCSPLHFELTSSYIKLIKSVICNFSKEFMLVFFSGLFLGFFNAATAFIAGYFYSTINQVSQQILLLQLLAAIIFLSGVGLFAYLNNLWIKLLYSKLILYSLPTLFNQLLNLPLLITKNYSSGDLTQRFGDYEQAMSAIVSLSLTILFSFFSLLFLLAYMAYCNLWLAGCFILIGGLFLAIKLAIFPININHIEKHLIAKGKLTSFLSEVFLQIHKIRSANAERKVFKKWLSLLVNIKLHAERSLKIQIILSQLETLAPLFLLLACYYIVYVNTHNNMVLLLQFIICSTQFTDLFSKLSGQLQILIYYIPNLQRIKPLLTGIEVQPENIFVTPQYIDDINFVNVGFKHPVSEQWVLNDINLKISPGQFIGIVGASGSGKSTLFKLLLGFENISTGAITLGNENIKHINWPSIRKQFGVVLQTSNIFPGTILANLSIHKKLTTDEAWELAEAVGLAEDIHTMPMKLFTYISDNAGEAISGGQKQKILIARALSTLPRVLLLDEATSALDETSQDKIFKYLKKLTITRIVIAHRYSTLREADKIYVIDKGTVVDCCSYNDLIKCE